MSKSVSGLLSAELRTELRRIVRNHDNILNHVRVKSDVNNLPREELIKIADRLEIDWIKELAKWCMRDKHSPDHQTFATLMRFQEGIEGELEFDLKLSAFGTETTSKVRCSYTFSPGWQYFCPNDRRLKYRWEGRSFGFEIQYVEYQWISESEEAKEVTKWTDLDTRILDDGIIDILDEKVEQHIWDQDQINRQKNGFPLGDKSQNHSL